jgi:phosphohistidine swiveling domain-containing protein
MGSHGHAPATNGPLVVPFGAIGRDMLSLVGGKAANLGELTGAGLPVPTGFCVTTAAYALAARGAAFNAALEDLTALRAEDARRLQAGAAAMRDLLLAEPAPEAVEAAIEEAYAGLGDGAQVAVAVRSSATAEDLPFASFAGQQDTYLNVVGRGALVDAARRCWASLWTDRAVVYRATNGIDHRTVRLAVVVQRMVDSEVAGVMFTANPVTGRRMQVVIDAAPGLGEAVVSGAVTPDHFVVDGATERIVERRLGDHRLAIRSIPGGGTESVPLPASGDELCLSGEQAIALAKLGLRVEAHYGAPQDVEWAIDGDGRRWLTQARPITTLYPLPEGAPPPGEVLRVYFSVNVAQGVYRPLTPMGLAVFRLAGSSMAAMYGLGVRDPRAGPPAMKAAGQRLFIDATRGLRSRLGRALIPRLLGIMEARSAMIFSRLLGDPRLSVVPGSTLAFTRRVLPRLIRLRVVRRATEAILRPAAARARARSIENELRAHLAAPQMPAAERLLFVERAVVERTAPMLFRIVLGGMLPTLLLLVLVRKLLGGLATNEELLTVLRGLPHNPTTEMDLDLWRVALSIREDVASSDLLLHTPAADLAQRYRARTLPPVLQRELEGWLENYGHRAVAEIDVGLPRWAEDPAHIVGVLTNYLRVDDPELAPDALFERGARDAESMVAELTRRAAGRGRVRGRLVSGCLRRIRELAGLRELPKYCLVVLLAQVRQHLWRVGVELQSAARLESAEDVFFVDLDETQRGLEGADLRSLVAERRVLYQQELRRRHVPRVLLSDGTEPEAELQSAARADGVLQGVPASAGTVTAPARVILEPAGAYLRPGEVLVAPSTDPGWTPLFLTAGGLVMEMGGPVSHGAVVAREYGIPAVVGLPRATEDISTGQLITVDGSAGTVAIARETPAR